MKKTLSLFLSIFLIFASTIIPVQALVRAGDVDKDDNVTASDALKILQHSVKKITFDEETIKVADVSADGEVNSSDALLVLQYSVGKISQFPCEMDPESVYYSSRDKYYGINYSDFNDVTIPEDYSNAREAVKALSTENQEPAENVDSYSINSEGNLVYNQLSKDCAEKMDAKYSNVEKITGTLQTGDTVLKYSVPKNVTAYDCVPVEYSVYNASKNKTDNVYFEATAYDEVDRYEEGKEGYFDLTLPGDISVELEYEGYVSGDAHTTSTKPKLATTPSNDVLGTEYPDYDVSELSKSGTVKTGKYTWFKFKYTNTGNTILDGEGNGGFNFRCTLEKKNGAAWEQVATTPNEYQPLLDYLYPGESGELWCYFEAVTTPGDYRVKISGCYKSMQSSYSYSNTLLYPCKTSESTFIFTANSTQTLTTPNEVKNVNHKYIVERSGWVGKFEEFLTSFDYMKDVGDLPSSSTTGKLYIQVASFSENIVLKLMNGTKASDSLAIAQIPINVNTDDINIELNPYNENYHVNEDGTRTPLIMAQNMVDMRGNVDRGPYAADTAINDLKNMKEAGINLLATTETYVGDISGFYDMSYFMLDTARQLDLDVEGSTVYYYRSNNVQTLGRKYANGYEFSNTVDTFGWKNMDEYNGLIAKSYLKRYGDIFYSNSSGILPINIEENYGWLGHMLNGRYGLSTQYFQPKFVSWLQKAYLTINRLNSAYNSSYSSFESINPIDEGVETSIGMTAFTNKNSTYTEWSKAIIDMDIFRTVDKIDNYTLTLQALGEEDAKINLRSENSIYLAPGISTSTTNPHYRLCYYEQRRSANIPEILISSGIIYGDSSYTSIRYTPSEVYELTRQASKYGLNTMKTPNFNVTIDTVVNTRYGNSGMEANLNISNKYRVCNICTNQALFTYWKAIYEAGGCPGTMWMDYACDGLVTSTQYKEIQFFSQKVQEMLNTTEGKEWSTNFEVTERSFDKNVLATRAYSDEYINARIANTPRENLITDCYKK